MKELLRCYQIIIFFVLTFIISWYPWYRGGEGFFTWGPSAGGLPGLVPYLLLWILMPKRRYLSGQPILLRPLVFQNPAGFHNSIFAPESRYDEADRPDKKTNLGGLTFVWLPSLLKAPARPLAAD